MLVTGNLTQLSYRVQFDSLVYTARISPRGCVRFCLIDYVTHMGYLHTLHKYSNIRITSLSYCIVLPRTDASFTQWGANPTKYFQFGIWWSPDNTCSYNHRWRCSRGPAPLDRKDNCRYEHSHNVNKDQRSIKKMLPTDQDTVGAYSAC